MLIFTAGCGNKTLDNLETLTDSLSDFHDQFADSENLLEDLQSYIDSKSDSVLVLVRKRMELLPELLANSRMTMLLTYPSETESRTEICTAGGYAIKYDRVGNSTISYYDFANGKYYDLDAIEKRGIVTEWDGDFSRGFFESNLFDTTHFGIVDEYVGREPVGGRLAAVYTTDFPDSKLWFDEEFGVTLKATNGDYSWEITEWVRGGVQISDMVKLDEYTFD